MSETILQKTRSALPNTPVKQPDIRGALPSAGPLEHLASITCHGSLRGGFRDFTLHLSRIGETELGWDLRAKKALLVPEFQEALTLKAGLEMIAITAVPEQKAEKLREETEDPVQNDNVYRLRYDLLQDSNVVRLEDDLLQKFDPESGAQTAINLYEDVGVICRHAVGRSILKLPSSEDNKSTVLIPARYTSESGKSYSGFILRDTYTVDGNQMINDRTLKVDEAADFLVEKFKN